MNNKEDIFEIDLLELLGVLLHWIWLIAVCGIVGGVATFLYCKFAVTPQYSSNTRILVLNKNNSNNNATVAYSDLQVANQLTKNYAQLIKSRDVMQRVVDTCGLDMTYEELMDTVAVSTVSDTYLIVITVTNPDPAMAQLLAKEVRIAASEHIKEVMEIQAVNLETEANLPEKPSSPQKLRNSLIGALLCAFACAGIIVVRYLLDDTIKSAEDVEKYLGLSTLAMIPIREESDGDHKKKAKGSQRSKSHEHRRQYYVDESDDEDVEVHELSDEEEV